MATIAVVAAERAGALAIEQLMVRVIVAGERTAIAAARPPLYRAIYSSAVRLATAARNSAMTAWHGLPTPVREGLVAYRETAQAVTLVDTAASMFDMISVYAASSGRTELANNMRALREGVDTLLNPTEIGEERVSWLRILIDFGAAIDLPIVTTTRQSLAIATAFQVSAAVASVVTWSEPLRETAAYIDPRTGIVLNLSLQGSLYVIVDDRLQPARELTNEVTEVFFIVEHTIQDYVGDFAVTPGGSVVIFTVEDASGETTQYPALSSRVTRSGVYVASALLPKTAPPFTVETHGLLTLYLSDADGGDAKFATLAMHGGSRVNAEP